jgi:hypothetical protein
MCVVEIFLIEKCFDNFKRTTSLMKSNFLCYHHIWDESGIFKLELIKFAIRKNVSHRLHNNQTIKVKVQLFRDSFAIQNDLLRQLITSENK